MKPSSFRFSYGIAAIRLTVISAASIFILTAPALHAQTATNPPIHVVRIGLGNLEGLKFSISAMSDACRIIMHLPPQPPVLPSDAFLARFVVLEQEDLFDGKRRAEYITQRQIAPDATSGCKLVVFAQRNATAYLICSHRILGSTPLLAETIDFENPSSAPPTVTEETLSVSTCNSKFRVKDSTGLPLIEAGGGVRCFWNGDLIARQMAKISGGEAVPPKGFDICLYEALPTYYYLGSSEPVILMTHILGEPKGGSANERIFGESAAPSHMNLKSFSATEAIPQIRFERPAVETFLNLPVKSSL
jgi:hypothetical protein